MPIATSPNLSKTFLVDSPAPRIFASILNVLERSGTRIDLVVSGGL
jgi:hypothetical protein